MPKYIKETVRSGDSVHVNKPVVTKKIEQPVKTVEPVKKVEDDIKHKRPGKRRKPRSV